MATRAQKLDLDIKLRCALHTVGCQTLDRSCSDCRARGKGIGTVDGTKAALAHHASIVPIGRCRDQLGKRHHRQASGGGRRGERLYSEYAGLSRWPYKGPTSYLYGQPESTTPHSTFVVNYSTDSQQ